MTVQLYPFQEDDIHRLWIDYGGRAIDASSMGLGKGVKALEIVRRYVTGPVVVVCPAGLKEQWKREAEEKVGRRAEILSGMKPPRGGLPPGPSLYIVNYDILRVATAAKPSWVTALRAVRPELIILDEIQYVKQGTTKRGRAVRELCRGVPRVLGLSGTPLTSRPIELWHPLAVVRPNLFPSRHMYGLRYANAFRSPWGWDYSGASHTNELHALLTGPGPAGCMVRRRKEDVLDQLPPKTQTVVPFSLSPSAYAEYARARDEFLGWLAEKDKARALRAARVERLARVGYLKRLVAELKLPSVLRWVGDFLEGTDEKLLLFGIHRHVLRPLFDQFRGAAVFVDGSVTGLSRQAAYDRFNGDPYTRLLVANMHAAGVGWSCTSASTEAFVELDWVPGNMIQAEDRIRGLYRGTGMPVQVNYLVADRTIESSLCEINQAKTKVLDAVLDGKPSEDMNLIELLEAALKAEGKPLPKRKKVR